MKALTRTDANRIKFASRIFLSTVVMFTLIMFTSSYANAGNNLSKAERGITKQINKMIEYPQSILDKSSENVMLFFELDEAGTIHVHKVEGINEELNGYVEALLEGKQLDKSTEQLSRKYKMAISFKTV